MIIYLPSNGLLGLTSIDMRNPIIEDIRHLHKLSDNSTLRKTQFVKMLANPELVDKITPSDRDYCFWIAAAAFSLNKFNYSVQCPCGKTNSSILYAGQVDPVRLSYKEKSVVEKVCGDLKYTYRRLSVKAESDAIFFAMDGPDEDYEDTYIDAVVAYTLFGEISPDTIKSARLVDISVYYSAYFYQHYLPHGIDLRTTLTCEKCGKPIQVIHPINGDLINVDIQTMMKCFVSLGNKLDLKSFFDLSLPEYNLFVQTLNNKLNSQ